MLLQFPEGFLWGTSTSAAQIETAFDHQFKGIEASDGFIFERTIDHEKRRAEDATYITQFGNIYRCSVDWSRLQLSPLTPFDAGVVREYRDFFEVLQKEGVRIMFVLYHFAHPSWFEHKDGWLQEKNIDFFVDFARRCQRHFGEYIHSWNTFNEPNAYVAMAYLLGNFPPYHRRRLRAAWKAMRNMGSAHEIIYDYLHARQPDAFVGVAQSVARFKGANFLGRIPALLCHWWYNRYSARFFKKVDFWGVNYYAYVPFDPRPVTEIQRPGRLDDLGISHDDIWGYRPQELVHFLNYFHKKYGKPVVVTESGICSGDPGQRIQGIKDYLRSCHEALKQGVDLRGYIH
jgi:beta-glucosidase